VTTSGLAIEVRHADRLCYAMQQSAVPWLHQLTLHNDGDEALRELVVKVELVDFSERVECRVDSLPAGASLELDAPDLPLRADAFASLLERARTELVVQVLDGDDVLAQRTQPIDVLAYNEWPGLEALPSLLAAFVSPNHPALSPVLHAVAERLERATGDGALDGYQKGDPERVRATLDAVHVAVSSIGVRYVSPPPSFEEVGQKVRLPEQVVGERLGTCLDLALLYAALCEHIGLDPFVIVQRGHALVGCWVERQSLDEPTFGSALELRKAVKAGVAVVIESTVACVVPPQSPQRARAAGDQRLDDEQAFCVAVDIAAARRVGMRPLPLRTSAYRTVEGSEAEAIELLEPGAPVPAAALPTPVELPPPPANHARDRLEHWQHKLLDLSMFNRLLNFVETKKTVRLSGHDLGAIEDRLQSGARMRLHAKPRLGADDDPRDLELESQRTGTDVVAEYLAEELRAGRWRCELDHDALDTRLTEIFRHARTSIEESGANTLYLGLGFLRWFESDSSQKPRRAPLLLLPIVIERLSVQEGYRFVMDDAEVRVNTTLLQLLERDFDLSVPIGDPLPEDERGVDVGKVLDVFRRTALAMPRWEVEDVAHLGFFSFTKYLMWLDLKNRDELLQSAVLRHLIEAPGAALPQEVGAFPRDELDELDPSEVFCPKDADSSQLSAVMAGSAGRSFVLEGPPGTGKSQTITNLIAQSLAIGKRVLFVAEKRAALEVVHHRLADVGLGPFCLELHSTKSGPKAVLEQLRMTLELGYRRAPEEWQDVADRLQAQRGELNDFVHALHRRREHGWSVHQAMSLLVQLRDATRLPLPELLASTPEVVATAREAVGALVVASASLGVPDQAPWWGVRRGDWTPAVTRDFRPMAERLQRAVDGLRATVQPLVDALSLQAAFGEVGPSHEQLLTLLALLRALQAPSLPPSSWLRLPDWREFDEDLERAIAIGRRRDDLWSQLEPRWRRDLLALDLGSFAASYRMHAETFFVFRWWRLRKLKPVLAGVAAGPLGAPASIRDDLERALRVRDEERELRGCATAATGLGSHWRDGLADWGAVDGWLRQARELRQLVLRLLPGSLQPDAQLLATLATHVDAQHDGASPLPQLCGELFAAHDEFAAARQQVGQHLDLDLEQAFGVDVEPGYLDRVSQRVAGWLRHEAGLRDQCAYRRAAAAAEQAHLGALVTAHASGELLARELRAAFDRSVYEGWLDLVHQQEPELARFRGQDHEAAIARFAELDRKAIELGAKVVVARLAAKLPRLRDTQVASSELGILERELKKQRRHKPVRRLLAEIRGLWPRLSPCVLMSPLSVAQFLDRDAQRFDLVVFDEASQIPMWDAVGAIGRGESLIVVGDSKQLPPTSFFQRVASDDDVEVDDVPEDLESVLDECAAAGLPRMHLDWHYRSRHESLIAFSNHHYYQNRLLTFPAPEPADDGAGVRCVRVDGVYDRAASQQNKAEAEALVAAVVRRLRDPELARRSIGIVTFSRAQQSLIEDLLDAERRADPSLDTVLAEADEELFVKNLENVQGDERDVILFSICYGPDAAGKIYENYGPLNLQGGERRLNVAVTRARRELVVFSSVGPEQVANRSTATGARHLRHFLDYALRGEAALVGAIERDPSRDVDSPFEASVRDALVARGHTVHTQIGCSGYRIDLAVEDPARPGSYLLGIECDGATYHRAATARDRDRLRAAVLRGLGWRLVRVWSTDYWQDADGELERLEVLIEQARGEEEAQRAEAAARADEPRLAGAAVVGEAAGADEPAPSPEPDRAAGEDASPEGSSLRDPSCRDSSPRDSGDQDAPDDDGPSPEGPDGDAANDDEPESAHVPPPDPDGPRPHELLQGACASDDGDAVRRMLEVEAPMVFERLVRRLAEAWDVSRVTDKVRARVRAALPPGSQSEHDTVWAGDEQRAAFRGFRVPEDQRSERSAEELPMVEVTHAMVWLLRQHHALAAEDLMRECARCFGISRLGSNVREVMARGVDLLVAAGHGVRNGDHVSMP
jgi:very-short-patch-repair endonuclease